MPRVRTLGLTLTSGLSAKLSFPFSAEQTSFSHVRGSLSYVLLDYQTSLARARHAGVQWGISSTVSWLRELKQVGDLPPTPHLPQVPVRKSFLIDLPFAMTTMHGSPGETATFPRSARLPSPWQSEIIASRPKKCKRFFSLR